MRNKDLLSIIIATKNRPEKLHVCVKSILNNDDDGYEIIIANQGDPSETAMLMESRTDRIRCIQVLTGGKAHALNCAIQAANGSIFAFTDDDCITKSDWVSSIKQTFRTYPKIEAIFGETSSYNPQHHQQEFCPSCFKIAHGGSIIKKPCIHYSNIGFGNNMAIRKRLIESSGGFKTWLGPGSLGSNAEDAEIALRLLILNKRIYVTPNVKVFHNKWLSASELVIQQYSYACGEMACYGYFYFQKYSFADEIIRINYRTTIGKFKRILKSIRYFSFNYSETYQFFIETLYKIRGLAVGFIYSKIDPL